MSNYKREPWTPAIRQRISDNCRAYQERVRRGLALLDAVERGLVTVSIAGAPHVSGR